MVRHESTPDRQQKEEVQAGELVHEEIKDFAAYVLSLSTPQDVSQEVKDEQPKPERWENHKPTNTRDKYSEPAPPPDDMLLASVLIKLLSDRQLTVRHDVIGYVLPRMEDPVLTQRAAIINTRYPGANAARVETLVTDVIE